MPRRRLPVEGGYFRRDGRRGPRARRRGLKSYARRGTAAVRRLPLRPRRRLPDGDDRGRPARAGRDRRRDGRRGEAPRTARSASLGSSAQAGRPSRSARRSRGRAVDRPRRRHEPQAERASAFASAHGAEVAETRPRTQAAATSSSPRPPRATRSARRLAPRRRARLRDRCQRSAVTRARCTGDRAGDARLLRLARGREAGVRGSHRAGRGRPARLARGARAPRHRRRRDPREAVRRRRGAVQSNGIAPWDVAIGHEVLRRARDAGVGVAL